MGRMKQITTLLEELRKKMKQITEQIAILLEKLKAIESDLSDEAHWSDCALHGVDTGTPDTHDGISYEGPCSCRNDVQR